MKHGDKWFCWICRQPMTIYRKMKHAGIGVDAPGEWSTQYRINGHWRDCHEECYDEYSDGMPTIRRLEKHIPDTIEPCRDSNSSS